MPRPPAFKPSSFGSLPCAHYPLGCVGCTLIGRPYGEQLAWKRERVRAALATAPELRAIAVPEVSGSPRAFGYRNQAKLVARQSGSSLLLGIYRPGTHEVVDIRQCPVHHPLIQQTLGPLASLLQSSGLTVYDERTQTGSLRYVIVRVASWPKLVQVILVTRDASLPQARLLGSAIARLPRVASVVHNSNASPGNAIFGPRFTVLTRQDALIEKIGAFKLKTHAGAFLQANIQMARRIYEYATRQAQLTPQSKVFDLYCGAGAMSFHLATQAHWVTGIEASPIAIGDAKENIRLNGFHNVRFHEGDVGALLAELGPKLGPIDVVTLNPPRKGADEATRRSLVALTPQRIIYTSCDPNTLTRDLAWLAQHGYRTEALQPFDLLPQTEHVECVATLVQL